MIVCSSNGLVRMGESPAEIVPCAGAVEDQRHWSGVAAGQYFDLVFFFDATRYTKAQVSVPMARCSAGEVSCREGTHSS